MQQELQSQGSCWAWAAGRAEPFAAVELSPQPLSPALKLLATIPLTEDADPILVMLREQCEPYLADSWDQAAAGQGAEQPPAGQDLWQDVSEPAYSLPEQLDTSTAGSTLRQAYAESWLGLKLPAGHAGQPWRQAAQLQASRGGAAECTESRLPLQLDACLLQLPAHQVRVPADAP